MCKMKVVLWKEKVSPKLKKLVIRILSCRFLDLKIVNTIFVIIS